jgi:hypothetical protein
MKNKCILTIGFLMSAISCSLFSSESLHQRNLHLLDFIQDDTPIYNATGEQVPISKFDNKCIQLYFTATFCGPCKKVSAIIQKHQQSYSTQYEVIVLSWDSDDKLTEYMSKKPHWHYVKYDVKLVQQLNRKAHHKGRTAIPTYINFDIKGNYYDLTQFYKWFPKK